jgi:multimeric flavodoxin WrbA
MDDPPLSALFLNCTLKRSPERSHTQGLIDACAAVMTAAGVCTQTIRVVDHDVATGVWPDMTGHGWERDVWPAIQDKVFATEILVLAGPIWLGDNSSVMKRCIERLYGSSSVLNSVGQYAHYGRVGGCLITGNEDGIKHCAMNILYSLQHLGYTIPPQADAGWIGQVGPGPSYLDPGSGGPENDVTNRNTYVYGMESDPPRTHPQGRRRCPGPRQSAHRVGRRRAVRLGESGIPALSEDGRSGIDSRAALLAGVTGVPDVRSPGARALRRTVELSADGVSRRRW